MGKPETDSKALSAGLCPQWKEERRKHGMESDMKKILGILCEVAKIMRFLKEINIYEEI